MVIGGDWLRSASALLFSALGFAATAATAAPQRPLWEVGLGVGLVAFGDYRGADTGHVYPVPVPYFVYRGRILRADRDGVRGLLLDRERVELNISVNATTPVRSRDSHARLGMPNLQPTLEVGPSLDLHLWHSANHHARLDLQLPARTVWTIERSPEPVGWLLAPHLNLNLRDVGGHAGWDLGLLAGPLFAGRRYHEYYYRVAPQFAVAGRPAYDVGGGYSGSQALVSLSKRFPGFWVGAFARYDTLRGAVFAPSPIVRSSSYWAAGVGIAWMIGRSSRIVDAVDERQ